MEDDDDWRKMGDRRGTYGKSPTLFLDLHLSRSNLAPKLGLVAVV